MKIKLYNHNVTALNLNVLAGRYDPESQTVVLIVRSSDDEAAGNLTLGVSEAHRVITMIGNGLPDVTRVVEAPPPPEKGGAK